MKFTRNRIGPGGKADYIVSQLREDVDWVHFDDRHIIVDENKHPQAPQFEGSPHHECVHLGQWHSAFASG